MANVLIVDDNFLENRGMKSALEVLGHTAVSVHTLKEGLDAAWDGNWDLILLDTTLPDGDGKAAVPSFKEATDKAPIFLAAREEEPYPDVADVQDVVIKPLVVHTFSEQIARMLGAGSVPAAVCGEKGGARPQTPAAAAQSDLPDPLPPLKEFKEEQEIRYLKRLVELTDNDVKKAMEMASISRAGYYNLLKKYDLTGAGKEPEKKAKTPAKTTAKKPEKSQAKSKAKAKPAKAKTAKTTSVPAGKKEPKTSKK